MLKTIQAFIFLAAVDEGVSDFHGRLALAPMVGFRAVEFRRGWLTVVSRGSRAVAAPLENSRRLRESQYCVTKP